MFAPQAAMKAIAQQIADRDSGVRTAALNTLVVAHSQLGESLQKMVKTVITDKESSMLDERIKRAAKAAAAAAAAGGGGGGSGAGTREGSTEMEEARANRRGDSEARERGQSRGR